MLLIVITQNLIIYRLFQEHYWCFKFNFVPQKGEKGCS